MIPIQRRLPTPLFVVPPELTASIPDKPVIRNKPGPKPQYTKAERRYRHIKAMLRRNHEHRIDQSIAQLEARLAILKEIRDEMRATKD